VGGWGPRSPEEHPWCTRNTHVWAERYKPLNWTDVLTQTKNKTEESLPAYFPLKFPDGQFPPKIPGHVSQTKLKTKKNIQSDFPVVHDAFEESKILSHSNKASWYASINYIFTIINDNVVPLCKALQVEENVIHLQLHCLSIWDMFLLCGGIPWCLPFSLFRKCADKRSLVKLCTTKN
jgi:hypothetical protein